MTLGKSNELYNRLLKMFNAISYDLSMCQINIIRDIEELSDIMSTDEDSFPVEIGYSDGPPRFIRFLTPLYPPRLKVVLSLGTGNKAEYAKKDKPYARNTYKYVKAVWNSTIKKGVEQTGLRGLCLEKGIVWYRFHVLKSRLRDYDAFDERCINNALVLNGLIKDDNYDNLFAIKQMIPSDEPKTEIILIEDNGIVEFLYEQLLGGKFERGQ